MCKTQRQQTKQVKKDSLKTRLPVDILTLLSVPASQYRSSYLIIGSWTGQSHVSRIWLSSSASASNLDGWAGTWERDKRRKRACYWIWKVYMYLWELKQSKQQLVLKEHIKTVLKDSVSEKHNRGSGQINIQIQVLTPEDASVGHEWGVNVGQANVFQELALNQRPQHSQEWKD